LSSLRYRLQLGLFASVIVLMLLLWWLVGGAIKKFGEGFVQSRLEHDVDSLISALQVDKKGMLKLTSDRMSSIYKQPFSGHYFVVIDGETTLYSRSLWDESLDVLPLPKGEILQWTVTGPLGQALLVWSGGFQKQGHNFTVAVAEDLTPLSQALVRFNWYFASLSLAVLIVLLVVQQYIIRRSFLPLVQIRQELKKLQQGAVGELTEVVPAEVQPLVCEVNHLLCLLGERLQRSRNSMGNLAHALKAPLSLLSQIAQQNDLSAIPSLSEDLKIHIDAIQQLMDRELKRARLMGQGAPGARFSPQEEMPVLVDVLTRMFAYDEKQGKPLEIYWQAPETVFIFDRDDMLELIGNLLDNACKWAKHEVRIKFHGEEQYLSLQIEDDGPGCSDEEIERLTSRGVRIDEDVPGHGLGLAIVRDVVETYGGVLLFSRSSELGGLQVSVRLDNRSKN